MTFDVRRGFALFDVLQPPDGFRVDHALFLTYSLDLVVLVGAVLALGGAREEELDAGPLTLVEAFRRLHRRVDVVAQKGRMVVPRRNRDVLLMLDSMLHEAAFDERVGSWHPKLALVRYRAEAGDATFHRLWIGSRNLTANSDYEAGLLLIGREGGRRASTAGDKAVGAMIRGLLDTAGATSVKRRLTLKDLHWEAPEGTRLTTVHWRGNGTPTWSLPEGEETWCFSPFVDDDGLDRLAGRSSRITVVTTDHGLASVKRPHPSVTFRRMEVPAAHECTGGQPPTEEAQAPDDEFAEDLQRGLHAKLILQRGARDILLIGSANLTRRGLEGPNAEVLAQLEITRKDIADSLVNLAGSQMECAQPAPLDDMAETKAREELRRACTAVCLTKFTILAGPTGEVRLKSEGDLTGFLAGHELAVGLFSLPGDTLVPWPRTEPSVVLSPEAIPMRLCTNLVVFSARPFSTPDITHSWVQSVPWGGSSWSSDKRDEAALAAYIGARRLRDWLRNALDGVAEPQRETWDGRPKGSVPAAGPQLADAATPFMLEHILARWARDPDGFEERFHEVMRLVRAIAEELRALPEGEARAAAEADLGEVMPFLRMIHSCISEKVRV